jgi:hypothetical protein
MADLPSISVIVAVASESEAFQDCLTALDRQIGPQVEIIVASSVDVSRLLTSQFPRMTWLNLEAGLLIPELWGKGIAKGTAEIFAITTSNFVPAQDWIASIRDAHVRLRSPAIGGVIEPPRDRDMVSWATYFLRYSRYLRYTREQAVDDLAGDNASYKRSAVSTHMVANGFWEFELHQRLRAAGEQLMFVPNILVRQASCFGFREFLCQRFRHGLHFGRARARGWTFANRVLRILSSPLIPAVFFTKIALNVARSRRYFLCFLYALPALWCFLLSWTLGETCGYISASLPRRSVSIDSLAAIGGDS